MSTCTCPCLHAMSPCLCLYVDVSMLMSPCPCLHGQASITPCVHLSMFPCPMSTVCLYVSMSPPPCFHVFMSPCPYVHVSKFPEVHKRKTATSENGKGKGQIFVCCRRNGKRIFLGRQTINSNGRLLFQQTCSSMDGKGEQPTFLHRHDAE